MGVLNVTPDSLFGGILNDAQDGNYKLRIEKVARQMIVDGAQIIDVGGESTGPGSSDISSDEEWGRIEPVLKVLKKIREEGLEFEISIDTYKSDVLEKALKYGADILNDVTALRGDINMLKLVADSGVKVCIMYSVLPLSAGGNIVRTNNEEVQYEDVIETIAGFWEERIDYLKSNGISFERIILDPGMGAFVSGDAKYSFEILDRLGELKDMFADFPILVGASRKGFTGLVFDENRNVVKKLPVGERLNGSLAAAKTAIKNGADIIRVHDVAETFAIL
ncbi:MAG: dihydropteroate synthase [Candidatus Peregrinibacteria bacterium]|nr:dihydropteroate synthase [Candidatus Peregrinibacteria bacterium]